MKYRILPFIFLFYFAIDAAAQVAPPPREAEAVRYEAAKIHIDGELDEEAWKNATVLDNFIEHKPRFGMPENPANKTLVYILYDDEALYVGGYCHFTRDSITAELVGRDHGGNNDHIGIFLDTYNDKINGVGFIVTPLGEQFDARYSADENGTDEDASWNAVWTSESKIHAGGWSFEMRIPYSAIRFSPKNSTWGINVMRRNLKSGQELFWNPVNNEISGFVNQWGLIHGLRDIKPPLRLSLSPYFSAYLNHFPYHIDGLSNYSTSINGGADLKLGISQNFTLDMTLIPDFGQVPSDRLILNLSPFEVEYDERRPFFIEGTDLFGKGDLFYSRRVGDEPINKDEIGDQLSEHEQIIESPTQSKLTNAIKFSGRTSRGTGLGFFNAITRPMYAKVQDSITGEIRELETGPLSNFNIVVVDQSLKNNSSVSFINTNTLRNGAHPDANVNAAIYNIRLLKNRYSLYGEHSLSSVLRNSTTSNGYSHSLGFGKVGGKFTFEIQQQLADTRYDKNDLGIMEFNNYLDHSMRFGYKILKPRSFYNSLYFEFDSDLSHRFSDKYLREIEFTIEADVVFKNLWSMYSSVEYSPQNNDFYEPRVEDKIFKRGKRMEFGIYVDGNNAKKYVPEFSFTQSNREVFNGRSFHFGFEQRYKFNQKLAAGTDFRINTSKNEAGFARVLNNDHIIFSRRDRFTTENSLELKYNFSKRMGMDIGLRHYWSQVKPKQYYLLQDDGHLNPNTSYNENHNINLNLFNVDWVAFWEFRPGSFLNVVWKNSISDRNQNTRFSYFKNLDHTLSSDQNNNFSIKLLYYLDYQDLVR